MVNAPPQTDQLLDTASQSLFLLGRLFSRQSLRERMSQAEEVPELSHILIVQALELATDSDQEMTVGDLARQLGIDPSTASRLVAQALKAGYVARLASQRDGRAVVMALTPEGSRLATQARAWQRKIFEQLTQEWSPGERQDFARLFVRFTSAVAASCREEAGLMGRTPDDAPDE
ncbi:MAG: MarR family winged helix-turn-helix transcriptional regulator [Candidatus Sericytochromatia bacterium]